jgi:hypothetical protein
VFSTRMASAPSGTVVPAVASIRPPFAREFDGVAQQIGEHGRQFRREHGRGAQIFLDGIDDGDGAFFGSVPNQSTGRLEAVANALTGSAPARIDRGDVDQVDRLALEVLPQVLGGVPCLFQLPALIATQAGHLQDAVELARQPTAIPSRPLISCVKAASSVPMDAKHPEHPGFRRDLLEAIIHHRERIAASFQRRLGNCDSPVASAVRTSASASLASLRLWPTAGARLIAYIRLLHRLALARRLSLAGALDLLPRCISHSHQHIRTDANALSQKLHRRPRQETLAVDEHLEAWRTFMGQKYPAEIGRVTLDDQLLLIVAGEDVIEIGAEPGEKSACAISIVVIQQQPIVGRSP